eukprot:TRINITY_DN44600_c0_g1_i1.p1 TRINITY_DN44600_c0_g1~~TRINITY_DN44600_c0_g1_i1.p1  ORF type:complete len:737 (+),score=90.81 TRINITY_DN44600_c0_g1_i1:122-2332(+)
MSVVRVDLPDVEATEALGAALAHEVRRGDVIFLRGELGSGKTSLARGFLRRFFGNPTLDVPSPSYLLHFAYSSGDASPSSSASEGNSQGNTGDATPTPQRKAAAVPFRGGAMSLIADCTVHHVDPYRLQEGRIAGLIDFESVFSAMALIEWPERLGEQLVTAETPKRLEVCFEGYGPQADTRTVRLTGVGDRWQVPLERWLAEGGPLSASRSDPSPTLVVPAPTAAEAGTEAAVSLPQPPSCMSELLSHPLAAGKRDGCRPLPARREDWRVLGIESSCDDTGAAVLTGTGGILGEALASQAQVHEKWGGVVPRLAQEAHQQAIDGTVEEALRKAKVSSHELSAVSVTVGPGLSMCLEVGVRKALQIAAAHRLPLVRIHHMEAHMMVTRLPAPVSGSGGVVATAAPSSANAGSEAAVVGEASGGQTTPEASTAPTLTVEADATVGSRGTSPVPSLDLTPAFPFVTLLVSGGHNLAVLSRGIGRHTILGSTIDDSIGEAFDKTARLLGITQVPGGPHLERLAKEGDGGAHQLPMPLSKTRDHELQFGCDYSFSGLKTAVKTLIDKELAAPKIAGLTEEEVRRKRADIAAAFQKVAVRHLCDRAERATGWALEMEPSTATLVVAGGVAANQQVREGLRQVAATAGLEMRCPPPRLCIDNGVMVAWAGIERLNLGLYEVPPSESGVINAIEVRPRWPLGDRDPRSRGQKSSKGQASGQQKRKHTCSEITPPQKVSKTANP